VEGREREIELETERPHVFGYVTLKTYLKDVLNTNVSAWSVTDWTAVQTARCQSSVNFLLIP
jgi:hypothetical protein